MSCRTGKQSAYVKTKTQISCAVTVQLISTLKSFVFATWIVLFPFFLNPKFQGSSLLLLLYRLVCQTRSETQTVGFLMQRLIYDTPIIHMLPTGSASHTDQWQLTNGI